MKTALRAPTKYEAERIEAMMRLGCVCCAQSGLPHIAHECHHILSGGAEWDTGSRCPYAEDIIRAISARSSG